MHSENASAAAVEVIVFAPLRQTYDYLLPAQLTGQAAAGVRVWVPFGHGHRVGVVTRQLTVDAARAAQLKSVEKVLDAAEQLPEDVLALALWASTYYQYPIGEVLALAYPPLLRRNRSAALTQETFWKVTPLGHDAVAKDGIRGARQKVLLDLLHEKGSADSAALNQLDFDWRQSMRRLAKNGWVESESVAINTLTPPPPLLHNTAIELSAEQRSAVDAICRASNTYAPFLLNGVTGSGKTEVYFETLQTKLADGGQALVLLPEITLTRQLVHRFRRRFGPAVELLHSALSEKQRVAIWQKVKHGTVRIVLGTRSAVWLPFRDLRVVIVDEEHDASFKQQDGFRYSARDLALVRAERSACVLILGSATPSFESLANVERGKLTELRLEQRPAAVALPQIECLDIRGLDLQAGMSETMFDAMAEHLRRGEQVMLFLNRRGYAPVLVCRNCGEMRRCRSCDAYLVYHKQTRKLRCHHCDREWPQHMPANCCDKESIETLGQGTEQLEETVAARFPEARICRIDRDTMAQKGKLDSALLSIASREVDIVVGTQMITKGLDFSGIGLVGVVDTDGRLFSIDFRSEERLAQLLIQVAGRAGRADVPGRVLVQTYQPNNPVLRRILDQGYAAYAAIARNERRQVGLPPYSAMAVIRAESRAPERPLAFLGEAREKLQSFAAADIEMSYPIPALMERKAGRTRALIAIKSLKRSAVHEFLAQAVPILETTAKKNRVRWIVDVDPLETL